MGARRSLPPIWLWLGWAIWLVAVIGYAGVIAFMSTWGGLIACSDLSDGSPNGTAYFSAWPFGPGCEFWTYRRGPGVAWLVVAVALAAIGAVALGAQLRQRRRHVDRGEVRAEV